MASTLTVNPTGGVGVVPEAKAYTNEQLNSIIEARLARERAKYADYDDVKTKASEYDQLVEKSKTEQQKAVDAARKEGETSALERANTRLVRSEARALAAAAGFRDPADAVALINLAGVKVTNDGDVDADAIKTQLAEVAEKKAYLLKDTGPARPGGDAGQGPRGTAGPSNMNELIRGLGRKSG